MKIQCSCGAKYSFDITPVMERQPVRFVCPACGVDSSEFVDGLIRQELGQTSTPSGVPVPIQLPGIAVPPPPVPVSTDTPADALIAAAPQPAVAVRVHLPAAAQADGPRCLKHGGEVALAKCFVCGKPICPKCMELFGYLCSPLCKAKADSHGLAVPLFAGQKTVVETKLWRKVFLVGGVLGGVAAVLLGFWFWYAWFGSMPKTAFAVRFPEKALSGSSFFAGKEKEQIVFLHGATLARHDMKQRKEIWSRELLDPKEFQKKAERAIKEMQENRARAEDKYGKLDFFKIPSAEKLALSMFRDAAAELELHVRGQNVWVVSPGKLARYDWDTGKPIKELTMKPGYGGVISRGDELLVIDNEARRPTVTYFDLATGESRAEELGGPAAAALAAATNGPGVGRSGAGTDLAGLPMTAGKDGGKPMDPGKVAEQVQHLSLPAKLALPAVLSTSMQQERALAEMNDGNPRSASGGADPGANVSVVPTKDGFVQLSVKVLEAKFVEHVAMKEAPKKSALDGPVSAGNSMEVANEILNEMQRSRGGDKVREDLSRYQVTLRQPGGQEAWSGEVVGPPNLYPLQTVNVLTANQLVIVLDKHNRKLWQAPLSYTVTGGTSALDEDGATYGQGPCVERKNILYVIDSGMLTAFELTTGNVKWRLPSVGITGLFFGDDDVIYANTTTASLQSLKYSRQIDVSQKVSSVVQKIDPKNGKVLWTAEPGGLVNYVSGKFIFTVQFYAPPEEDEESDSAIHTGFETPPYLRIRRISPGDGHELWEHFQQRAPLDVQFDRNTIRLVFRKEVQVLKFMTF